MNERLQKIMAAHGLMSRRAAEEVIAAGRVSVNGVVAKLGDRADVDVDTIEVDGKPLVAKPETVHIMLHKPRGVVSTMSDEQGRPTVAELVVSVGMRVLPVGRLDMDSEGLLLMTNDAALIHVLTHPSHQVEKEYHVWVRIPEEIALADAVKTMSGPMMIEGYQIRPGKVAILEQEPTRAKLSVIIAEGRKRQVRHMCAGADLVVLRLQRVREGAIELGSLKPGTWRHLTKEEVAGLIKFGK